MTKIIVLSSEPLQPDGKFPDFKNGMYLGGNVRMRAAAKIAKDSPETEITLVGGYNKLPNPNPDTSDKVNDMASFVRASVPNANLRLVYSLPCSYHDFIAVFNTWKAENIQVQEVGILTNAYHLKRAEAFAHRAAKLMGIDQTIRFVPMAAEEILQEPIDAIVGDRQDEYNARLKGEAKGIIDLHSGQYHDNCLNENLEVLLPAIKVHADSIMTSEEKAGLKHLGLAA
jgi:hypothetical protein